MAAVRRPRSEMQHSRLQTTRSHPSVKSRSAGDQSDSGEPALSVSATPRPSITSPSSAILNCLSRPYPGMAPSLAGPAAAAERG
jgi:hypothetical protein